MASIINSKLMIHSQEMRATSGKIRDDKVTKAVPGEGYLCRYYYLWLAGNTLLGTANCLSLRLRCEKWHKATQQKKKKTK